MPWPSWTISRALILEDDDDGARRHRSLLVGRKRWEKQDFPLVDHRYFRRDKKKQKFLDLVERYYRQIRQGCKNPSCQYSTCLSAKSKQKTGAPFRRPTRTSARAMAVLLASADDPYRNLCPDVVKKVDRLDPAIPAEATLHCILHHPGPDHTRTNLDYCLQTDPRMRNMADTYWQQLADASRQERDTENSERQEKDSDERDQSIPWVSLGGVPLKIDTKSFIQVLFNTTTWRLAKYVQTRNGRYGFLPFRSPSPSSPREGSFASDGSPGKKLRFLFLSGANANEAPSIQTIVDRLQNDIGTSEALFRTFGTKGCPPGIIGRVVPYYTIEETIAHFVQVRQAMHDSNSMFLSLYEDSAVAYLKRPSDRDSTPLSHSKAAHVVNVCIGALLSSMPSTDSSRVLDYAWETYIQFKEQGQCIPRWPDINEFPADKRRYIDDLAWTFQDATYLALMRRILHIIASRTSQGPKNRDRHSHFVKPIISFIESHTWDMTLPTHPSQLLLEWTQTVLQHGWNNNPEFSWSSDVGSAITFMEIMYENRIQLSLLPADFAIPSLSRKMDMMEAPISWMQHRAPKNCDHLLSFPWLFSCPTVITYFRVINHSLMTDAFRSSVRLRMLANRHARNELLHRGYERQINNRLNTAMREFLVLNIRRGNILEDALNELFRRQKREMRRPLKIRMGMQEGEEGVDMGGIQQEFFRLALGEALDPVCGMFTVDETTHMTWFSPASTTPLHQFVLIGLMTGLAVYNGITLSVTFPLALYRKLLGLPVNHLDHIRDGWPSLTRGLRALLEYEGDDLEDVFMREYVFSLDVNGTTWSVDMEKFDSRSQSKAASWPPSKSNELKTGAILNSMANDARMVTKENREQYVADYIFWLTDMSVRRQYEAFATGFFMCADRKALRLFDPEALQDVVEGFQEIDVVELQNNTTYEGDFDAKHPRIEDFWKIVRSFSPEETRKLLEFVTASDRVPVRGIQDLAFSIMKNGEGDQRLPTSMTCFSRLLLPVYSSREVLESKLRQAIDNSLGFGVA